MYEGNIYHTPYTYPITGHTTKKLMAQRIYERKNTSLNYICSCTNKTHIEETFKCMVRFIYFNRNVVTDATLYSALR